MFKRIDHIELLTADPERAVGMHLAPIAWSEILTAANTARESKDPS